jgi:uncharacterized protein (TIGR02145 family)
MKKVFLTLVLATAAINLFSQVQKMYIMKNGEAAYQSAVAEIDSIIFYNPNSTTDEGVEINGVVWATRNVAAPGHFADNPEDPGMFYQWNSTIGWSATDPLVSTDGSVWNSSWTGNDATAWETSNNVCPAGWRVPTQAEQQSLIDAGSTWTTTPANGRIFGTLPNSLFLPAAGNRQGSNGALDVPGSGGYYWSSTADGTNSYILDFFSSELRSLDNRSHGFSCRCVTE